MKHKAKLVGTALLCLALGSQALTLGRLHGVALVGQPLNLVVPVQLEAGEALADQCFTAEVFHADTRQDSRHVRVTTQAGSAPNTAEVRIASASTVNEFVVNVALHAGCSQKISRRYVLLADLPSDAAPALTPPVVAPAQTSTPPAPIPSITPAAAPTPLPAAAAPARRAKRARSSQAGVTTSGPSKSLRATVPSAARPMRKEPNTERRAQPSARLQLDPLAFLSDRIANLDAPAPLLLPEESLRSLQRLQTLENSVKALTALAAQNEAQVLSLKTRLQQAEAERFSRPLVYGLGALALTALAALAWLGLRTRRPEATNSAWWRESSLQPDSDAPVSRPAPVPAAAPAPPPVAASPRPAPIAPPPVSPPVVHDPAPLARAAATLDVDLTEPTDPSLDLFPPDVAPNPATDTSVAFEPAETPPAQPAPRHDFTALQEVRQQAEFLLSLGQTDQAVQLYRTHLQPQETPNPYILLDWLGLVHAQDQRAEFERLRADFEPRFNLRLPEFDSFSDEGRDLTANLDVLARITAAWPQANVLTVIDAALFSAAAEGRPRTRTLDLAAFRDLLLLRALCQDEIETADFSPSPAVPPSPPPDLLSLALPDPANAAVAPPSSNLIEFDLPSLSSPTKPT